MKDVLRFKYHFDKRKDSLFCLSHNLYAKRAYKIHHRKFNKIRFGASTDKLQPTGRNLGRIFNFKFCHWHAEHCWCYQVKLPNLKLENWPKQLLGYLPLVIALPAASQNSLY